MRETAFDAWFTEQEGFSLRAERFGGDVAWLKAAFEAGRAAERERAAKIAENYDIVGKAENGFAGPMREVDPGEFIASSIRSPHTTAEDRT